MSTGKLNAPTISGLGSRRFVLPVSIASDWIDICTQPNATDNESGVMTAGLVVNPSAITRATQNWLQMAGFGTIVQLRLKYPTAANGLTNPVVQIFGRDRLEQAQRLVDAGGVHSVTLSIDAANDVRDATFSYTQPVECDANGCAEVLAAVKTALTGTGITGATIQARVK